MKKIIILLSFILGINILVVAQDGKPVDTREFFLSSRIKKSTSTPKTNTTKRPTKKAVTELESEPIGLGYTLYLRDENDNGVRVDPDRIFKTGDAVRLSLEPSIEGYLYIFYVENEGQPEMLYPHARLNRGENIVKAHVPIEIPSRESANPNLRWFFFSGEPAREKLYVVVSRSPLPKVPIREELVKHFQKSNNNWKPTNEIWQIIKTKANEPNLISKNSDSGEKQTDIETKAIDRKLGLGNDAPAPSTIKISKSKNTDIFATLVELIHK